MKGVVAVSAIYILLLAAPRRVAAEEGTVDGSVKGEDIGGGTSVLEVTEQLEKTASSQGFQAEVSRLMGLIINSLYSNRDVFLRELISNGSDALDKIRFESLTDKSALEGGQDLGIWIRPDAENNLLHIIDSGVGMTKDDLVNNLGTIAKSGTKEFLDKIEGGGDASSLIGQFGVGFYSAFLVADEVIVTSKNNNDDQYVWTSDAQSSFKVGKDPRGNTLGRGTQITLRLKEDASEYLNEENLRELVKKYSEFIIFPIHLYVKEETARQVPIEKEADAEEEDDVEDVEVGEEEEEEEEEEYETVYDVSWKYVVINNVKPIWTRDPSDVTEEEYQGFYSAISDDSEEPLTWSHFKAEGGNLEFRSLLYIPQTPPQDSFNTGRDGRRGVKLYVKRVFITDDFDLVIPKYLNFLVGVVDSDDLPLNVSREILQQNKSLKAMEKKLVRKAIAMIQEIAQDEEDPDRYAEFWEDYKLHIKLGVVEDHANRSRLSKLLRYYTSKSTDEIRSLDQYVEDMKPGQEKIYYLAGEEMSDLENSPLAEAIIAKGYEVLYMTDPIDEYVMQHLTSYEGKGFQNLAKAELDIDDSEDEEIDEEEWKPLTDFLKSTLKAKITKTVLSKRLRKTPSALVASGFGYTPNMERIMKAQALSQGHSSFMAPRKVLEINPRHPIVLELLRRVSNEDADSSTSEDLAFVLYDTAALHSGFSVDDPSEFASRIHNMIKLSLGLDVDAEADYPENEEIPDAVEEEGEEEQEHTHDEL